MLQSRPAASETVASTVFPFLISWVTLPLPIEQPRLLSRSTVNVTLPVSPCEKPTDSVFRSVWLIDIPCAS